MLLRFICPGCQGKVKAESALINKTVVCPSCRQPFPLKFPKGPASTADPEVFLNFEEGPAVMADQGVPDYGGGPVYSFARKVGLNPDEEPLTTVDNSAEADAALAHLKEIMPPVTSAYVPSGAMPAKALQYMLAGIPLGALASLLGAAILAVLAWYVSYGLGWVAGWLDNVCDMGCLRVVTLIAAVGLSALGIFATMGAIAALVVTSLGKQGKNRNDVWPALISLIPALASAGLGWLAFRELGAEPLNQLFKATPGKLTTVYNIAFLIGLAITLIAAFAVARSEVQSAKFCEECELYMTSQPLKTLRQGETKVLVHALKEREMPVAVGVMARASGTDGTPTLFFCPGCNRGFLEVNFRFNVTWQGEENTESKSENWMVASVGLRPEDVQRFQPFATGTPT